MFSCDMLAGDERTALEQPYSLVLTESRARMFFGPQNGDYASVLEKLVTMGRDTVPYKVTGVCKDVPENSHLSYNLLMSYITLYSGTTNYKQADYDFTDSDFWHYIQLKHGTDYKALEKKLGAFSDKYFQGNKVSGSVEKFFLQPLIRAHLYSDYEYEIGDTGSATVVWGLLIIALFIIVIAWVNYINLSTAKSVERAREVGVRKVTGATQGQLMGQFLIESLIINLLAMALAIVLIPWPCGTL